MSSLDSTNASLRAAPPVKVSREQAVSDMISSADLKKRHRRSQRFEWTCRLATLSALSLLAVLVSVISYQGLQWLDWQFLTSFPSRFPERAGIKSALYGTTWLLSMTALFAVPIGIGAAIYLEELMATNRIKRIIDLNIANLAGVPSIIYGILGLTVFVRFFSLDRSVLSGALTLSILVLPIIIISARESLRTIPQGIRDAALALGATRWEATFHHILPAALPGMMTGVILAISRAIGETAPLIMIGALTYVAFVPEGPMDSFTALPIQIFNWVSRPKEEFHTLAAAGIIVLLVVMLGTNALAIYLRDRFQRRNKWHLL